MGSSVEKTRNIDRIMRRLITNAEYVVYGHVLVYKRNSTNDASTQDEVIEALAAARANIKSRFRLDEKLFYLKDF